MQIRRSHTPRSSIACSFIALLGFGLLGCSDESGDSPNPGAGGAGAANVAGSEGSAAGGAESSASGANAGGQPNTAGTDTAGSGGSAGAEGGGAGQAAGAPTETGGQGPVAGAGGSDPEGGSAGMATPNGGGAATGDGSCDSSGLSFCSDFEDGLPDELTFYPEYQQANMANFVELDSTVAKSGSQSIKVTGTDFSQMLALPTPAADFWGRVYIQSNTDIQSGHNTYVAATDGSGDPNDGEHIRIGEHQCQLELNRRTDDAEKLSNGGTYECSGGIELKADTWYCLEFHYDGPGSEVQVFVDGTDVDALHVTDWGPYDYKLFKFGFEKYHGDAKTLWYDDLALGSERIGCLK